MIKQLAHISISSYDLSASEHFYCDILEMEKTFEFVKDGELYGFYAGAGQTTFVEVFIKENKLDRTPSIMRHMCLEVDDLDETITQIREKGWEVTEKTFGCDNSWQAWITDPSGVQIELMQYTNESSQFTGKPCDVDW